MLAKQIKRIKKTKNKSRSYKFLQARLNPSFMYEEIPSVFLLGYNTLRY